MKSINSLILGLLLSLSLGAQSTYHTIEHGGLTRDYSIYVPAIYNPAEAVPLVFNLHGYTSVNWQQEAYGDFRTIADTANFIIVHPNGTNDAFGNSFWNVGFAPASVDDVGFLVALIDSISASYNIDQSRVYSTGMSNGGFMSYELACQSGRLAAIASVTGSMTTGTRDNCTPQYPTPVLQIHGDSDPTVPYEGDASFNSLHVDTVISYWVDYNNCPNSPTTTAIPNVNTSDGATADHTVYPAGDSGAVVELIKIAGGEHTWPGSSIIIGVTCMDFSASEEIWRFFSRFSSPNQNIVATSKIEESTTSLSLYPNPVQNQLTIGFEGAEKTIEQIDVFDINGRLIQSRNYNDFQISLSVSDLQAGFYILRATDGNQWYSQQFVKTE